MPMKRQLYPVQVAHAAVLAKSLEDNNHALDASSTGTGKTLVAAELAAGYKRPTLVVGLKTTLPMWEQEMKDRGWPALGVINYEMLRRGKTPWGTWAQGKYWQWALPKDALIVWDEIQNCQGMNTQNSRMLIAAKPWTNLMLSATAAEDPTEMRATGYILGLHNLRDYWGWCRRNGCVANQWGGLEFSDPNDKIVSGIHKYLFPDHGSRLTIADLADHFQETQIITTPLEFGEEIDRLYAEMEKEIAQLAEIMTSDSDHPAAQALIAKLRARQKVEFCKVPAIIEMAEAFLKEGRSVVIFVNFDETINALNKRLIGAKLIRGNQTKEERADAERSFQNNTCRLLICNTQAGGVSLSLHDLHGDHPRVSIISPDWNAKKIIQALGRIHRAGGQTPSQQHVLFAAGTVEEQVEKVVRENMRRIGIFNDGLLEKIPVVSDKPVDVCPEKEETISTVDEPKTDLPLEAAPIPTTPEPEPEHATWAPSSLGNYEKCPGFRNRKVVESEDGSAARGTRIHKALEKDDPDLLKDETEKHLAQVCKDFIDSQIAERGIPKRDFREIRLAINLGGGLTTFGTADRLLVYGTHGIMYDYKSGYRHVADAEINPQGWAYTIGAFQRPALNLETLDLYFLIPNRDEISHASFKRSDVPNMQLRLNTIIRKAMAADPSQYNPQPELCEYCSRQATCPALAAKALQLAPKLLPGLPVPPIALVSKDRPQDIPYLLRLAPLMESWAEGVRAAALKLNLQEGLEIPGYTRIERSTPRSVSSVLGAWKVLKEKGKILKDKEIALEEFLAACSKVSVPQLEDYVASLAPRFEKGKARQALNLALRGADLLREEGTIYYLKERKK